MSVKGKKINAGIKSTPDNIKIKFKLRSVPFRSGETTTI